MIRIRFGSKGKEKKSSLPTKLKRRLASLSKKKLLLEATTLHQVLRDTFDGGCPGRLLKGKHICYYCGGPTAMPPFLDKPEDGQTLVHPSCCVICAMLDHLHSIPIGKAPPAMVRKARRLAAKRKR